MSAWRWILLVLIVVATTMWATTWSLLSIADEANPGTERATARIDAVRTALAAAGGSGAAVLAALAFRRQHQQEVATVLNDHDATERRITELYSTAAEQLGSDKAPVRLAALYSLERLAQDNPGHRQTVVNLICAYLRMPFAPKARQEAEEADSRIEAEQMPSTLALPALGWKVSIRDELVKNRDGEEFQVRLTAQRVLEDHLRSRSGHHPERYWPGVQIDLEGATLVDFNFVEASVESAEFSAAVFVGGASFRKAIFAGSASFRNATFVDHVSFSDTAFVGQAMFQGVRFASPASFRGAKFSSEAHFYRAQFARTAAFHYATFGGRALFDKVNSDKGAQFQHATFERGASFRKATFGGGVDFDFARFDEAPDLDYLGFDPHWRCTFDSVRICTSAESVGEHYVVDKGRLPKGWIVETTGERIDHLVRTEPPSTPLKLGENDGSDS